MALFFLIVVMVLSLMYGYIGWRLIIPAAFSTPVNGLLWGLLVIFVVLPFFTHIANHYALSGTWVDVIAWIGYLSFGFFTLLFALLVTRDLIFLISAGASKAYHLITHLFNAGSAAMEKADPERRRLLVNTINLGLLGVTAALTGYGLFEALRKPAIVEIPVPINNLPQDLDGYKIVQITDLHVSHTIRKPFIQAVVASVNELDPDLVVLTGDLVDGSVDEFAGDVAPLADLKASDGTFFVTGNHEYYSGVEPWLVETARLGFTNLMNEHRVIKRGDGLLLLAGVTDYSGGDFNRTHLSDPHRAAEGAPECHVRILLAHQPKSIFEAARAGFDYVITGHTHGGQYFPYHFLAALAQPYISGLHRHGNTRIYVSNGTGYWGPQIRLGARSEITVHRLTAA